MNFSLFKLGLLFSILCFALALHGEDTPSGKVIPLWTGDAPGEEGREDKEQLKEHHIYCLVHRPTLELFLSHSKAGSQPFLLICPGGGYNVIEYGKEGNQIAQYFLQAGFSVGILKYRTIRWDEDKDSHAAALRALEDAGRAMRLIRAHSQEWNVDPKRVGIIGFSAGAHLAANVAMHPESGITEPPDSVSAFPANPDFLGLIYGFKPKSELPKDFPPTFLVHGCSDSMVSITNSIEFESDIRKNGGTAELHTFTKAIHGFALGEVGTPESAWPALFKTFLRTQGF